MLRRIAGSFFAACCFVNVALAGGPVIVGGPGFGHPGQAFTWDPAKMPIQYRVDPGPMAVNPSGQVMISNPAGLQRVQNILAVWQGVSTAAVSFTNAGTISPVGVFSGSLAAQNL